jgi:ArsR family metal-binding transcriptional regulator
MAKVTGVEDAAAQLEWFQSLCNATWRRREAITPLYERRTLLGHLDVYRLLPGLNCGECGVPTCMAFAFGLLMDERRLSNCPHVEKDQYAEGGRRLAELLGKGG